MASEKSGYNIIVTCTQNTDIIFACKAKKRPGVKLGNKIDMTTDTTVGCKLYEPGDLLEITDGELTVIDDFDTAKKITEIIGKKGTITFTGRTVEKSVAFSNSWFASYTPDSVGLDGAPPTATIVIQASSPLPS